ncbi:unnamed protein product [Periconia digitata]|uniref:Uncharacterized protein n=1 Tax=Periconia digitata TaxID=1303443 RepID=A0A9W4UMT7_9PLEO|nr:unnamed protein product [Periconia digitata]
MKWKLHNSPHLPPCQRLKTAYLLSQSTSPSNSSLRLLSYKEKTVQRRQIALVVVVVLVGQRRWRRTLLHRLLGRFLDLRRSGRLLHFLLWCSFLRWLLGSFGPSSSSGGGITFLSGSLFSTRSGSGGIRRMPLLN